MSHDTVVSRAFEGSFRKREGRTGREEGLAFEGSFQKKREGRTGREEGRC